MAATEDITYIVTSLITKQQNNDSCETQLYIRHHLLHERDSTNLSGGVVLVLGVRLLHIYEVYLVHPLPTVLD